MTVDSPQVVGGRYELLGSSGVGQMGVVYQARDLLTGSQIALKRVEYVLPQTSELPASTHPSLDLRSALASEFRVLASLRHPYIISVLDYGFDAQRLPFFTMEFLSDAQTIVAYGATATRETRRRLLSEMIEALAYLHRHDVLHCDLKPDNVLVTRDGVVKVLDFGLAAAREQMRDRIGESYGTLPYAAPELFDLQPNSERSDLFSLGIIAYEMLTGVYPFVLDSLDDLIESIRQAPIPIDAIEDEALRPFVARLLMRDPVDRYASADEARADLARLLDLPLREAPSIRESYLQGARFIGREEELDQLTDGLRMAIRGQGSAWLLGGESGVGKSRLMEELRIRALVRGVTVLRGQATVEGDAPYSVWRDALRLLVLNTPLNDFEAGVLKPILPEIDGLIRRPVTPAPEIDPKAAQDRLSIVIEDLFRRQSKPLVLLIEDLHWASESLTLLRRLVTIASDLPLLIVGTYRNDERPDLPSALSKAQVLSLHRFEHDEIESLCVAILGEAGRRPDLLNLLTRETEGNAFFIVQVLRAIAEEVGQLSALSSSAIPSQVVAGGIQAVIDRRLSRIAPADRALLETAAVAGRQLDLTILQQIVGDASLEEWLLDCGTVLEITDNQWRFAHDKLRERLLGGLSADQRRTLHHQVASAMEAVYNVSEDKVTLLAYHFAGAGDFEKEAHYTALGGAQFLKQGSYREAHGWLMRAETLAEALGWEGLRRARLVRNLAEASLGIGLSDENIALLKRALNCVGIITPAPEIAIPEDETRAAVETMIARVGGVPLSASVQLDDETLRLVANCEIDLAYNYPENTVNALPGAIYGISAVRRLEQKPPSPQLANAYAILAMALMTCGIDEMAEEYAQKASHLLMTLGGDEATLAWGLSNLAYYWTFVARWQESARDGQRAANLYQDVGDLLRWRGTLMNLAASAEWQGDLAGGYALRQQEYAIAERAGSLLGQVRAMAGLGQMEAYMGRTDDALATLSERKRIIERIGATSSTRWTYMAMAYYRGGDYANARDCLPGALAEIGRIVSTSAHDMFALSNATETLLGLWDHHGDADGWYRANSDYAIAMVRDYHKRYFAGRPLMDVFLGRYHWLIGEPDTAEAHWKAAIALCERIGTPYAEGMAYAELARRFPEENGADHKRHALAIFDRIGAAWDAGRLTDLGDR